MRSTHFLQIVAIMLMLTVGVSIAQNFSIDGTSPEYSGTYSTADIVYSDGSSVSYTAADLGLSSSAEIDGFSFGVDVLVPTTGGFIRLYYSVDRSTVGLSGSIIESEASSDGAAGDKFSVVYTTTSSSAPELTSDATDHGLTPLPTVPYSDVDGLSLPDLDGDSSFPVFFSVDAPTAASLTAGGFTVGIDDIILQPTAGTSPGALSIWATDGTLGLVAGDDIDALAVLDEGTAGTYDSGDIVYFSLTAASPSAATLGSASIIMVTPGSSPVVFKTPAELGLLTSDDLNAITAYDPGPGGCGDYDRDGEVGAGDFAQLALYYMDPACSSPGNWCSEIDLDDDGSVTDTDVIKFSRFWLKQLNSDPNDPWPHWFEEWDCPTQCKGDADCSGGSTPVDFSDFLIYKSAENTSLGDAFYDPRADFSRNLTVDNEDYLIYQAWFLSGSVPTDCSGRCGD